MKIICYNRLLATIAGQKTVKMDFRHICMLLLWTVAIEAESVCDKLKEYTIEEAGKFIDEFYDAKESKRFLGGLELPEIPIPKIPGLSSYEKCLKKEVKKIIDAYEKASSIFGKQIFAINEEESADLPNLLETKTQETPGACTRDFPAFVIPKIKELQYFVKTIPCNTTKSRRRRAIINNADGSVTNTRICTGKGQASATNPNKLNLNAECWAVTTLPEYRYPRYINEVICDDPQCLSGEGASMQMSTFIKFKNDTNNVGLARLGEWVDHQQEIRTSCKCLSLSNTPYKNLFI